MTAIKPQFITDETGNKISAVLPIKVYETLMEELEELEDIKLYDESKSDGEAAIKKDEAMAMIEANKKSRTSRFGICKMLIFLLAQFHQFPQVFIG